MTDPDPDDGPAPDSPDPDSQARDRQAEQGGRAVGGHALDPVRQRRAKVARLTAIGQRIGYGLFAVAVVAFFVGLAEGFPQDVIDLIIATMAIGSIVLAPSIVFAYAVKAADRDDLEHGR